MAHEGLSVVEVGEKFNRLTAISEPYKVDGDRRHWVDVVCECGIKKSIRKYHPTKGLIKSCGCLRNENTTNLKLSHGRCNTPTHTTWTNMKSRCSNSKLDCYKNYGGRGITYDPRWESFENFLEDMGERPEGMTLDRIDPNGNYCKENCRWADNSTQTHNQRKKAGTSSKYFGVSYCSLTNKWVCSLRYEGKAVIFERFDNEKDAAIAYDKASYKVYKDRPNYFFFT